MSVRMEACQHQRGQRNVTEAENNYLLGKEYESQRKCVGGDRDTARDEKSGKFTAIRQNGGKPSRENQTAQIVAKANNVGRRTVERAADFAKGIDAAEEVAPAPRKMAAPFL